MVVVNLNARKGYRVSPGVNQRARAIQKVAKEKPLDARKASFMEKKKEDRVINLGQMDAKTCEALNGVMNENRQCMVNSEANPEDPDTLIIKKMRYQRPGDGILPDGVLPREQPTVKQKPKEKMQQVDVFEPKIESYSIKWALDRIQTCIDDGYEENLCVGSILGEMRKKGKYKEFDKLLDEEYMHDFDSKLITIIKIWKTRYDARFNEKMGYLNRQGLETTPRRIQIAIQTVYPEYDRMMKRPLLPKEERRRKLGGEIPEWLYEQQNKPSGLLHKGGRPRLADSIPMHKLEQQEELEKRFREMTIEERKKVLTDLREPYLPYDRRRKTHTTMTQEEREKYLQTRKREQERNYYYLNRYGMTEKEYKTRKKIEWGEKQDTEN